LRDVSGDKISSGRRGDFFAAANILSEKFGQIASELMAGAGLQAAAELAWRWLKQNIANKIFRTSAQRRQAVHHAAAEACRKSAQ